jgi:hypothetical protein
MGSVLIWTVWAVMSPSIEGVMVSRRCKQNKDVMISSSTKCCLLANPGVERGEFN